MTRRHAIFDAANAGTGLEVLQAGEVLTTIAGALNVNRTCRCTVFAERYVNRAELTLWGTGDIADGVSIGLVTESASLATYVGGDAEGVGFRLDAGIVYANGVSVDTFSTSGVGLQVTYTLIADLEASTPTVALWAGSTLLAEVDIPAGIASDPLAIGVSLGSTDAGDMSVFINSGRKRFERVDLVDADGYYVVSSLPEAVRIGTVDFLSASDDAIPNTRWKGCIRPTGVRVRRSLNFPIWEGDAVVTPATVTLTIDDPDHDFDRLLNPSLRDTNAVLQMLDDGETLDDAQQLGDFVLDSVEVVDDLTKRVTLRDNLAALQRGAQNRFFLPYTAEGAANRPWPWGFGAPYGVKPVLFDTDNLRYAIADGGISGLGYVRDDGDPLTLVAPDYTVSTSLEYVQLANQPAGTITLSFSSAGGELPGTPTNLIAGSGLARWDTTDNASEVSIGGSPGILIQPTEAQPVGASELQGYLKFDAVLVGGSTYRFTATVDEFSGPPAGLYPPKTRIAISPNDAYHEFNQPNYINYAFKEWRLEDIPEDGVISHQWTQPISGRDPDLVVQLRGGSDDTDYARFFDDFELVEIITDPVDESTLESVGFETAVRTILETRAGLASSQWSATDAAAIDAELGFEFDGYFTDEITVEAVLARLCASVCGAPYRDRSGVIRFALLRRPEDTPSSAYAFNHTKPMLKGPLKPRPDLAPGLSVYVAGRPCWHVMEASNLATDQIDVTPAYVQSVAKPYRTTAKTGAQLSRAYAHAEAAAPIETLLHDAADVQALADRIGSLYSEDGVPISRQFWEYEVDYDPGLELDQVGGLSYPWYGDDGGPLVDKAVTIVGLDEDPVNGVTTIIVWG